MRRAPTTTAMIAALVSPAVAPPAAAYRFSVQARTVGQGSQVRAYRGADVVLLSRRRVSQVLDLRIFELLPPPDPDSGRPAPRLNLVGSLRLDTDFGDFAAVADARGVEAVPPIAGDEGDPFDLLLLYLEGRDLLGGRLDFRAGRQLLADPLDYYAFDGADVVLRAPLHVAVEAFGGFEVKAKDPLASPVWELDGTPEVSLLLPDQRVRSPMFGAALQTWGLRDLSARASYRRTFSTRRVLLVESAGAEPELRAMSGIEEEKAAASVRGNAGRFAQPWAGARYNLLTGRVDLAEAGARVPIHPRHAVTPSWAWVVPDFSGDSIFNLYALSASHDAGVTWDAGPFGPWRGYARALARRFANDLGRPGGALVEAEVAGSALALGATAGARWTGRRGLARADARFEDGYGGRVWGGDLSGQWTPWLGRVALDGRASALRFESDLRDPSMRRATYSAGAAAGARYTFVPGAALHLGVEQNLNNVYRSETRALAVLDLAYLP